MEAPKDPSCPEVRAWLQDRHDREGPQGPTGLSDFSRAAEAHLEGCAACRRFEAFLNGYGAELAGSLEQSLRDLPPPDMDALRARLENRTAPAGRQPRQASPARQARRLAPTARSGPTQRRRPAARLLAAAAVLSVALVAAVPGLVIRGRTARVLRSEMTALVDAVFAQPLAQGVEGALAAGPLLDALAEGDGIQGLGEGEAP